MATEKLAEGIRNFAAGRVFVEENSLKGKLYLKKKKRKEKDLY